MRDPLLGPLAALATGILIAHFIPFERWECGWLLGAFGLLAIAAHLAGSRWLWIASCLLAVTAGGLLTAEIHRPGPPPEIDAGPRELVLVSGCVVDPTVFSEGREQFTVELAPGARARVTQTLREGDEPRVLSYGQQVEFDAHVRPPHNYNNPGSFDYASYLARQQIYWTASVGPGILVRILPGRCGSRFTRAIFALRTAALERLEKLYAGNAWALGMTQAFLIGESSRLERVWTENFRRPGTYHALVISGLHVMVLAGVLLFLLRICLLPELPALAIAAAGAWIYALVSGWQAPVVRAAGGFTLYLLGRYFYRRGRILNLLAAVAVVFLVFDPAAMYDASFQLSFLSVAALGALAAPLIEASSGPLARATRDLNDAGRDLHLEPRLAQFRVELRLLAETVFFWTRIPERWLRPALGLIVRTVLYAYELVLISAVVQVGVALPMAIYFHRISFTGLSANVVIIPLMEIVVPVGFLAIFTQWPAAAWCTGTLLAWSEKVAAWHASHEPAWRVPDPPLWLAITFVAALLGLAFAVAASSRRWRWPAFTAVMASFALLLWHPGAPQIEPGKLELAAIDVGEGDSLLVAFPDGKLMVVDGGGFLTYGRPRKPRLEIGEDVVSPYLWSRGIRRVDLLVLTHAHADHLQGLHALLDNFRPRELWTGANPDRDLIAHAARLHTRVIPMSGARRLSLGRAQIDVLAPVAGYDSEAEPKNNDSLVFRIQFGERSYLLTGDSEKLTEDKLLELQRITKTDVLKVAHHGSATASSREFLDAVQPAFAVISVGYENSFRHPHPSVLARLAERHAGVYRTDLAGLVSVKTDGQRIAVDTAAWSKAGYHLLDPF